MEPPEPPASPPASPPCSSTNDRILYALRTSLRELDWALVQSTRTWRTPLACTIILVVYLACALLAHRARRTRPCAATALRAARSARLRDARAGVRQPADAMRSRAGQEDRGRRRGPVRRRASLARFARWIAASPRPHRLLRGNGGGVRLRHPLDTDHDGSDDGTSHQPDRPRLRLGAGRLTVAR